MADIKISLVSDEGEEFVYDVEITEGGSTTEHKISVNTEEYEQIADGEMEPEDLVRKSLEFLLEREPKEAILSEFNIKEISRYFSEYEDEVLNG